MTTALFRTNFISILIARKGKNSVYKSDVTSGVLLGFCAKERDKVLCRGNTAWW
jgi:hypothetical protein